MKGKIVKETPRVKKKTHEGLRMVKETTKKPERRKKRRKGS